MLLDGKVVAITGASEGIGAACAVACARQGADVAINYIGEDVLAETVARAVADAGRRCSLVKGDVSDPAEATRFVSATVAALADWTCSSAMPGSARSTVFSICRPRFWSAPCA